MTRFQVGRTLKEPIVALVGLHVSDVLLPSEVAVWKIVLDMTNPRLMCQAPKSDGHAQFHVISAQEPVS